MNNKRILLVAPHGFCAGVARAVAMAEALLRDGTPPIYGLNPIVHNATVIERLTHLGFRFVSDVHAIPPGATALFSAHGVSPAVREVARQRGLKVVDATCPFVDRLHQDVRRRAGDGDTVLLIGHRRHEEVVGVVGEAPEQVLVLESVADVEAVQPADPAHVSVLLQTTLNADETTPWLDRLAARFPKLHRPSQTNICYATRNRQWAVRATAVETDRFIVLGSANSSNSNRLVEVARSAGTDARLVDDPSQLATWAWQGVGTVGVTAGASTPEASVQAALDALRQLGFAKIETREVVRERVSFGV